MWRGSRRRRLRRGARAGVAARSHLCSSAAPGRTRPDSSLTPAAGPEAATSRATVSGTSRPSASSAADSARREARRAAASACRWKMTSCAPRSTAGGTKWAIGGHTRASAWRAGRRAPAPARVPSGGSRQRYAVPARARCAPVVGDGGPAPAAPRPAPRLSVSTTARAATRRYCVAEAAGKPPARRPPAETKIFCRATASLAPAEKEQ